MGCSASSERPPRHTRKKRPHARNATPTRSAQTASRRAEDAPPQPTRRGNPTDLDRAPAATDTDNPLQGIPTTSPTSLVEQSDSRGCPTDNGHSDRATYLLRLDGDTATPAVEGPAAFAAATVNGSRVSRDIQLDADPHPPEGEPSSEFYTVAGPETAAAGGPPRSQLSRSSKFLSTGSGRSADDSGAAANAIVPGRNPFFYGHDTRHRRAHRDSVPAAAAGQNGTPTLPQQQQQEPRCPSVRPAAAHHAVSTWPGDVHPPTASPSLHVFSPSVAPSLPADGVPDPSHVTSLHVFSSLVSSTLPADGLAGPGHVTKLTPRNLDAHCRILARRSENRASMSHLSDGSTVRDPQGPAVISSVAGMAVTAPTDGSSSMADLDTSGSGDVADSSSTARAASASSGSLRSHHGAERLWLPPAGARLDESPN